MRVHVRFGKEYVNERECVCLPKHERECVYLCMKECVFVCLCMKESVLVCLCMDTVRNIRTTE